jgi:hypothetical protein
MGKRKPNPPRRPQPSEPTETSGATLKELLSADVIGKLKQQADALKSEEAARRERERKLQEEAKATERKRQENDFEYLLNNSGMDWKKYK